MKKLIAVLLFSSLFALNKPAQAQEVGISFSYFLPKNGYFSTPISPFSLRGLGIQFGDFIVVQSGFSLYRMSGMNVTDLGDLQTKDPIVGPNFTMLIPAELVLQYVTQNQEFKVKGGGFGFGTFDNNIMTGNLDKAIRTFEGWDVANSDVDFDSSLGFGVMFGAEYVVYVTSQWGLSFEVNYYIGGADFPIKGSYTGGNMAGPLVTREVDYKDATLDFTGLEISLGVIITQ
ncbi:MAG: hypothetical protein RLO81_17995 [Fulvivirga sp.]|uniref:hypothetical protein n=1 Tax=Fulvivirga sp. TaxID=1931237 RepID=UPI0032EFBEBA